MHGETISGCQDVSLNKLFLLADESTLQNNNYHHRLSNQGELANFLNQCKISFTQLILYTSPAGNTYVGVTSQQNQDQTLSQLSPVRAWGTDYTVVPVPGRAVGDRVRIISRDAGTSIQVSTRNSPIVAARYVYHYIRIKNQYVFMHILDITF